MPSCNHSSEHGAEGILTTCPDGQPDTEGGKGFIDQGNVACVIMPQWFMSRYLDEIPSMNGKLVIAPVPVFSEYASFFGFGRYRNGCDHYRCGSGFSSRLGGLR